MLGIIGAMDEEVAKIKEQMDDVSIIRKASMEFYKGKLKGKEMIVVRCGIGKVNAAVCTQILIGQLHATAIINTGIAGSLQNKIDIGDIVLSTDVIHHDMDATGFGYPKGQIPRMSTFGFAADEKLCALAEKAYETTGLKVNLHKGRVASGDQFVSDSEQKERIISEFQAYCTEMEGAAIAQTAYLNETPFLIIRAISDKADNSAHMDYSVFEAQAIENSVKLVVEIVENYK